MSIIARRILSLLLLAICSHGASFAQASTWQDKLSPFLLNLHDAYFQRNKTGPVMDLVRADAARLGINVDTDPDPQLTSLVLLTEANGSVFNALRAAGAEILSSESYTEVVVRYRLSQLNALASVPQVQSVLTGLRVESESSASANVRLFDESSNTATSVDKLRQIFG